MTNEQKARAEQVAREMEKTAGVTAWVRPSGQIYNAVENGWANGEWSYSAYAFDYTLGIVDTAYFTSRKHLKGPGLKMMASRHLNA